MVNSKLFYAIKAIGNVNPYVFALILTFQIAVYILRGIPKHCQLSFPLGKKCWWTK